MEKQGKRAARKRVVEWGWGVVELKMGKGRCSHSSFKIFYALLRSVFVLFFGFVCLSTAYILVLICVIEWLVLISISFLPTSLLSAARWVSRVFPATRCGQFRNQETNYV